MRRDLNTYGVGSHSLDELTPQVSSYLDGYYAIPQAGSFVGEETMCGVSAPRN